MAQGDLLSDADVLGSAPTPAAAPTGTYAAPAPLPGDLVPDPRGAGVYRDNAGNIKFLATTEVSVPGEKTGIAGTGDPAEIAAFLKKNPQFAAVPGAAPSASNAPAGPLLQDKDIIEQPTVAPAQDVTAQALAAYPKAQGVIPQLMQATGVMGRNIANAASLGAADRLEAGVSALPALMQGPDAYKRAFSDAFTQEKLKDIAGQAAYPVSAFGGQALGYLGAGTQLPVIAAESALGRAGIGAAQAGLLGGTQGFMESRGNLGQMSQGITAPALESAAAGGVLGPVIGARPVAAPAEVSLKEYALAGVDPMAAINGPESAQRIGQALKGLPLVGTPLTEAAERTSGQLGTGIQSTANALGVSQTPFEAGTAIQQGAQGAVSRMKNTADLLYARLNPLEQSGVQVPATNTTQAIADMFARYPNIPDWLAQQAPKLVQVQKTLAQAGGNLTYGELKAMRSDIGKMIDDHLVVGNIDQARLKTLYGAMSDDMKAGVGQTAKEEALKGGASEADASMEALRAQAALGRADAYYAAMHERIANTLKNFVPDAKTPEQAYARVLAMASTKSTADITQLGRLTRSIDPEAKREFAAGMINQMGRAPDGTFSVAKFASQYRNMNPEARRLILGSGDPSAKLDALAKVAQRMASASKFYNYSGSGHAVGIFAGLEQAGEMAMHVMSGNAHAAMQQAGILALTGIGGRAASTLLASPGFARLVLKEGTPEATEKALAIYARNNPSLANEVRQYSAEFVKRAKAGLAAATASGIGAQLPKPRLPGPTPQSNSALAGLEQRP